MRDRGESRDPEGLSGAWALTTQIFEPMSVAVWYALPQKGVPARALHSARAVSNEAMFGKNSSFLVQHNAKSIRASGMRRRYASPFCTCS